VYRIPVCRHTTKLLAPKSYSDAVRGSADVQVIVDPVPEVL
jgi:hypothetical protein